MRLYELDMNNPIDRELSKTSDDIEKDGSLDQNDIDAQNEPANPETMSRPSRDIIDQELLTKIRNHDYVTRYIYKDGEHKSSNPMNILKMRLPDLSNYRNTIHSEITRASLTDKVGMYASPTMRTAHDLLSFVDIVLAYMMKKKSAEVKKYSSHSAKFKTQDKPQTKSGVVKRPKFKEPKHRKVKH